MESIGSALEHQSSDIHLAADQAIMKIEVIRKKIDEQFSDLTTAVGEALVQLKNAGDVDQFITRGLGHRARIRRR